MPEQDSALGLLAVLGVMLTAFCVFVAYDAFGVFAVDVEIYFQCISGEGGFEACGDMLVFDYRYGIDAGWAIGLSLLGIILGPIPVIILLRQRKSGVFGAITLLLILVPYGAVALFVITTALLVVIVFALRVAL